MSDAREKAWARYWPTRWFQPNDAGLDVDTFNAGWDAAKADLPDEKTIAETLGAAYGSTPYRDAHLLGARAVLSLLRGETNGGNDE